jgi:hypothetical protein
MAMHDAHAEHRSYQYEKLSTAVRGLAKPEDISPTQLAMVMHELTRAFHHAPPPPGAEPAWQKIQMFMQGNGSWEEKATRLQVEEIHLFLTALWDLYDATGRAYYTA